MTRTSRCDFVEIVFSLPLISSTVIMRHHESANAQMVTPTATKTVSCVCKGTNGSDDNAARAQATSKKAAVTMMLCSSNTDTDEQRQWRGRQWPYLANGGGGWMRQRCRARATPQMRSMTTTLWTCNPVDNEHDDSAMHEQPRGRRWHRVWPTVSTMNMVTTPWMGNAVHRRRQT
jgi:hypothetical protein